MTTVYLVYIQEDGYSDTIPQVIRSSAQKARQWCDTHRRLSGNKTPIEWDGHPEWETGTCGPFLYHIEPFPYE